MYTAPQKRFRARAETEVLETIRRCADRFGPTIHRVFLADGDALVLSTRRLLDILVTIRTHMLAVHRVSSYCLARNLRDKPVAELRELADAGLALAYVGAESGDDTVLAKVRKGEIWASTADALHKLKEAGIARSVMILNSLGGAVLSARHADNSARFANATQPEYLSTLVVSFPDGEQRFRAAFPEWEPLPLTGLFGEMERFLSQLELARFSTATTPPTGWCSRAAVCRIQGHWPSSAIQCRGRHGAFRRAASDFGNLYVLAPGRLGPPT